MKLGNNEKIVLAILKNNRNLNKKQLHAAFKAVTKKEGRIDTIIHSLRIKGFLAENDSLDVTSIRNIDLPEVLLEKEIINELESFEDIRLGKLAKSIIYLLYKTDKSSLQFLAKFFGQPTQNIHAILQRLEDKSIVSSYNSRIRRVNTAGRRYHPKYYVLTEHGKTWLDSNISKIRNKEQLDVLLKEPETQIKKFNLKV